MKNFFLPGQTVLFQGDSVTDCARNNTDNVYGYGYAGKIVNIYNNMFSDAKVSIINPENRDNEQVYPPKNADSGVTFINRGVSGNKVSNLLKRFEDDFVAPNPDFISILIGVNEIIHHIQGDEKSYIHPQVYSDNYTVLLERIKKEIPKAKIMIIEPFILPSEPRYKIWNEELIHIIPRVHALAKEYADFFLPMNSIFVSYLANGLSPQSIAKDCVHPSPLGHSIIAREYLKLLGIL